MSWTQKEREFLATWAERCTWAQDADQIYCGKPDIDHFMRWAKRQDCQNKCLTSLMDWTGRGELSFCMGKFGRVDTKWTFGEWVCLNSSCKDPFCKKLPITFPGEQKISQPEGLNVNEMKLVIELYYPHSFLEIDLSSVNYRKVGNCCVLLNMDAEEVRNHMGEYFKDA